MIILVSPAKTLEFEEKCDETSLSTPELIEHSCVLMKDVKKLKQDDLKKMMKLSDKLAELNFQRNQDWGYPFKEETVRPAAFAFRGDVYQGLDYLSLKKKEKNYLQKHLRILSGLYGLLKPQDAMLAYRLEMGTKLKNSRGKNLYDFWEGVIRESIQQDLSKNKSKTLINLASNEYFKAAEAEKLGVEVVTPVFKDWSKDTYKVLSFFAKKARGLMCRYMAENNISNVDDLKSFNVDGYKFDQIESKDGQLVFKRKAA